ncbi:MAG: hypothetical protein ABL923_04580 [Burkholderiaceae bacterium]
METQNAVQKPQPVATAVNLLWASMAVGLVKMLMDFSYLSAVAPAAFTNFVLVFTFALIAFLIFKISVGRNWARITFLVMFVIGMLPTLPLMLGELSRSPVVGALSVAQVGLQVYALFLLFTQPGSVWFRKVASA